VNAPWPDELTAFERFVVGRLCEGLTETMIARKWTATRIDKMQVVAAINRAHKRLGLGLAGRKALALIMWRSREVGKAIGRSERLSGELQARRENEAQLPPRRLGPRPAHLTQT
jgi:hypothetical protein